jgi:serine/threonine protein kinase
MHKEKEDVWALGVNLYLLSSFILPFDVENKFELAFIKKITDQTIPHKKIENNSKELNALIDTLLNKDHEKRPTIK